MRRFAILAGLWALIMLLAPSGFGQRGRDKKGKPEPEEVTQALEVIPDPPASTVAETANLAFHLAPLSAKGLLTKQAEDAIKAIEKQAKGGSIVRVRAFVGGTADMRRVTSIVAERFAKRKKPIPVITVVRVGLLPLNGAQVAMEGISVAKKPVNPNGLLLISGQAAREPVDPAQPRLQLAGVAAKSVDMLRTALTAHSLAAADVLRLGCFVSSLDDGDAVRQTIATAFPAAVLTLVQVQRIASDRMVECEAVARLKAKPAEAVRIDNPTNAAFARAAVLAPGPVLLTTAQLTFGAEDNDVRLAFNRLKNTLDAGHSSFGEVFYLTAYPVNGAVLDKFRRLRFEFLDRAKAPASTNLAFEGLPSLDATMAVDVMATVSRP